MSQRAINDVMVELTLDMGCPQPDGKTILDRKSLEALCDSLDRLKKTAIRAMNKGGLVVVEQAGRLITTYGLGT